MSQIIHVCQSVSGAIANWTKKEWDAIGRENGRTGHQMKETFRILEFEGVKVIPIGDECEGFSYESGCPGHEKRDQP